MLCGAVSPFTRMQAGRKPKRVHNCPSIHLLAVFLSTALFNGVSCMVLIALQLVVALDVAVSVLLPVALR